MKPEYAAFISALVTFFKATNTSFNNNLITFGDHSFVVEHLKQVYDAIQNIGTLAILQ